MLTHFVLTAGRKQSESFELKQVDNSAELERAFREINRESEIDRGKGGKRNITSKVYQTVWGYVRRCVCVHEEIVGV